MRKNEDYNMQAVDVEKDSDSCTFIMEAAADGEELAGKNSGNDMASSEEENRKRGRRAVALGMMVACVILMGVIVAVIVGATSNNNKSETTAHATRSPQPQVWGSITPVLGPGDTAHVSGIYPNGTRYSYYMTGPPLPPREEQPRACNSWAWEWLGEHDDNIGGDGDDGEDHRLSMVQGRQRYALAVFFCELLPEFWFGNDARLKNLHECDWFNTTDPDSDMYLEYDPCGRRLEDDGDSPTERESDNRQFRTLVFPGRNLTGTLPSQLSMLSESLVELDLSDNHLSGSIPSDYAQLSMLRILDLTSNDLYEQDQDLAASDVNSIVCPLFSGGGGGHLEVFEVDLDDNECDCC